MSQPFRLIDSTPALPQPDPGWAGATIKDARLAQAAIGALCNAIWNSPILASEIVAGGLFAWRQTFMRAFRGYRLIDVSYADLIFADLQALHAQRYPGVSAREIVDLWAPPTSPTQAEIDAAWELESDSTEEARKFFYKERWDAPHRVMQELNDPKAFDPIVVR